MLFCVQTGKIIKIRIDQLPEQNRRQFFTEITGVKTMDLFEYAKSKTLDQESPLASRLRPRTLDEVVGQSTSLEKTNCCIVPLRQIS